MVRLHAHSATTRPREPWSTPATLLHLLHTGCVLHFHCFRKGAKEACVYLQTEHREEYPSRGFSVWWMSFRWQIYLKMSNIRNMYDRYVEMKHALCDNCSAQIFLNGPVVAPVTLMNDFLVYRQAMVCQAASLWVCVFFKYQVGDTAEKSPHHKQVLAQRNVVSRANTLTRIIDSDQMTRGSNSMPRGEHIPTLREDPWRSEETWKVLAGWSPR